MKIRFVFILLIGFLFCTFGVSLVVGSILCAPQQKVIGSPPEKISAKTVTFRSQSGSDLSGWFLTGKPNQGGMLLMHGVRENRLEMLDRAVFLNQVGYSVLLFDFQAHGESQGKNITFGYLESLDAEAGFKYLQQQIPNQPIGVIGISLGGASALLGSVANDADAVVLEAVYPTFNEAVSNRLSMGLGSLGSYFTPFLTWQIKPRLGFNPQMLSPIERISQIKTPVLIVAGSEDKRTLLSQSNRLFQRAAGSKEIWVVSGAVHKNFHLFNPEEYEQRILRFFKRYL